MFTFVGSGSNHDVGRQTVLNPLMPERQIALTSKLKTTG